jgi:hypothetical protein
MIIQRATPSKGFDTIATISRDKAAQFKAAGYDFVVRYLCSNKWSLTTPERDNILEGGLGLLVVGNSRLPGWHPSADLGTADGIKIVSIAKACGLPEGMSIFCDMEGPGGDAHSNVIAHVNAWAKVVQEAGYVAGLYVGFGIRLTPEQLYHELAVTAYWDSCSTNPNVAVRGFQMRQLYPANQHVCGVQVDIDTISPDNLGDTPNWLIND